MTAFAAAEADVAGRTTPASRAVDAAAIVVHRLYMGDLLW
jgi:hypothetical protein